MIKNVLVTGATGFIGGYVLRQLRAENYFVRAADIASCDFSCAESLGAEKAAVELSDAEGLKKACGNMDAVVHLAGIYDYGAPDALLEKVNVQGTENMCAAAQACGVKKFVMFSTIGVYGRLQKIPAREDHPQNPTNGYERTKRSAEQIAMRYFREKGLPVAVLRPTLVYGPRSKYGLSMFLSVFSLVALSKNPSLVVARGGAMTHCVHAEDVGRAVAFVLKDERTTGQAFHLADDTILTAEEFTGTLMKPLGVRVRFYIPSWIFQPLYKFIAKPVLRKYLDKINRLTEKAWNALIKEGKIVPALRPRLDKDWLDYLEANSAFDNSKLKALGFAYSHPDFRKSVPDVIRWYIENKWIPDTRRQPTDKGGGSNNPA